MISAITGLYDEGVTELATGDGGGDVDAEIVQGAGREAEFVGDAYRRILLA